MHTTLRSILAAALLLPATAFAQLSAPETTPGLAWTKLASPANTSDPLYWTHTPYHDLNAIAANGLGRYVVAGNHGMIAFSDNGGSNWTSGTTTRSLENADIAAVSYDASQGVWVAITGRTQRRKSDNKLTPKIFAMRSTDGAQWWARNVLDGVQITGTATGLRGLANNGNGTWMAGMNDGRVLVSVDGGITWATRAAAPAGARVTSIAYWFPGTQTAQGRFYACVQAAFGTSEVRSSTDAGLTWSAPVVLSHTCDRLRITRNNSTASRLIVTGEDRGISVTSNGTIWTNVSGDTSGISIRDVGWTNRTGYVAAGQAGAVMRSNSETSWNANGRGTLSSGTWITAITNAPTDGLLAVGSGRAVYRVTRTVGG